MITLTNYFSGQLLRLISFLILKFSPSLKSQFSFIKQTVAKSTRQTKKIPDHLTNSLIQIEDRRFFQHQGVDVYAIIRAVIRNTTTTRLEGASTIVQQLVRNITDEREIKFIKRKIKEIIIASLLDNEFSKDEILFAYLDTYKFKNYTGILAFCQYENYNLDNLSINQSAEIAARFKYPTLHQTNYIKYLKRVRTIERKTTPNTGLLQAGLTNKFESLYLRFGFVAGDGFSLVTPRLQQAANRYAACLTDRQT